MYGGEETEVELEFDDTLIDVVYDQFGFETKIKRLEKSNLFSAKVRVQISRTFWGWYFQFPEKMRIISPQKVLVQCQEWARQAL